MKMIRKDQKGSALVTVIIVVAFISILATTLLYVSGVNFQMKVADTKTKESFYNNEIPLERVKADLVMMSSETIKEIYPQIMCSMGARINDSDAQDFYRTTFLNAMKTKVDTYMSSSNISAISNGFDITNTQVVISEGKLIVEKLKLTTIMDDYTSVITTDIVVLPPDLTWSYDYAVQSASPTASASPTTSPTSTSGTNTKLEYYNCVYYQNWEKQ